MDDSLHDCIYFVVIWQISEQSIVITVLSTNTFENKNPNIKTEKNFSRNLWSNSLGYSRSPLSNWCLEPYRVISTFTLILWNNQQFCYRLALITLWKKKHQTCCFLTIETQTKMKPNNSKTVGAVHRKKVRLEYEICC